jgi:ribosomal protein S18 acetylase RimI-like enzyme
MQVRAAVPSDEAPITRLLIQLGYSVSPDVVLGKLLAFQNSDLDSAFVAIDRNQVVGCVSVHALELFHAPGRLGRITSLIVEGRARRSGVGTALVKQAMSFFHSAGCVRVEVTSGEHRTEAHAFYKAMDFDEDERRFVRVL